MIARAASRWFLGLMACVLAACFKTEPEYAGSVVTNPPQGLALHGTVSQDGDGPAARVRVSAYPSDYDPVEDSARVSSMHWIDTTDGKGAFRIEGFPLDYFNVWCVGEDGSRALIRDLQPDSDAGAPDAHATLQGPGALSILIYDALPRGNAYVYLEGTPLKRSLDLLRGETGTVVLDSVPSGFTPKLFHKTQGANFVRTLLGENIRVRPGDTVPVGVYRMWKYSKRLFINTGATGAATAAKLVNFPLLVRLDSSNLDFSQAKDDGSDLRFARKDGIPLNYEIEAWDKAARKAVAWVKVDTVYPGKADQFIRMYWGATDAVAEPGSGVVFDTGGHYQGVWHFQSVDAGPPPAFADASTAGNAAVAGAYPRGLQLVETPFGLGARQNGDTSFVYGENRFDNPQTFTLTLWFRTTSDSGGLLLGFNELAASPDSTGMRDRHLWLDSAGLIHFGVVSEPKTNQFVKHVLSGTSPCNEGRWHFAAARLSSAGMALMVDGVKVDEDASVTLAQNYSGYWHMGYTAPFKDWPHPPAKFFAGDFDEVRVTTRSLTDDWLKLSYETQRTDGHVTAFDPD